MWLHDERWYVCLFLCVAALLIASARTQHGAYLPREIRAVDTHVLSAIMGGIDTHVAPRLDNYHFFDDTSSVPRADLSPRLRAKYFKMCGHQLLPGAAALIWMDGSMEVKGHGFVDWLIGLMGDADCAFFQHDVRRSVKQELDFCMQNIDSPYLKARYASEPMAAQVSEYERQGYNIREHGLVCAGLFIRRTTPKVNAAFDAWFMENVKWSIQDQLSFPYIAWRHKLRVRMVRNQQPQSIFESEHHRLVGHAALK